MISYWNRLRHRRQGALAEQLTKAAQATTVADAPRDAVTDAPVQVLRENRRILLRARALTDPIHREVVAASVRNSVLEQAPENLPAVERLLRACRAEELIDLLLAIPALEYGSSSRGATVTAPNCPERSLHNTLFWCERLSREQAEEMESYFGAEPGMRWMVAVRQALDEALHGPGGRRPRQRTLLARLLAPYVTSQFLSVPVLEAAAGNLREGDLEVAQLFFQGPHCSGSRWLQILAENLADLRRFRCASPGTIRRHGSV